MGLKILLITPPYHCGILEIAGRWTPVNYVYLAGELRRAGHEPVIYDAMTLNHDLTQIVERVRREQPDLVGLTAFTPAYPAAIEVLTAVKRLDPKITTVFGGIHPTLLYAEVLTRHAAAVDYVIRGEGERTIVELADCLSAQEDAAAIPGLAFLRDGKLVVTPKRTQMTSSELDQLQPAWDACPLLCPTPTFAQCSCSHQQPARPLQGSTLAVDAVHATSIRATCLRTSFQGQSYSLILT